MKVALFFLPREESVFAQVTSSFFGRFNIGGFMFIRDASLDIFLTSQGNVYSRYTWNGGRSALIDDQYLLLPLDEEEQERIFATCRACAQVKKPFNLQDILLLHVPFREVEDLPIDLAPVLNNAQAIILILRECLRTDNRLREGIEGLHSRQTLLEDLFERLRPLSVPATWANISCLVKPFVCDRERDPASKH